MTYIHKRKESRLQEANRLEKEQFKKQIALLQDYYQKDAVRNKVREAFATLLKKWNREDGAFSLGIHYRYTNLHNRTYGYRLVLYGEAFYLDERAIEAGWKPELFFSLLEEDVEEILNPLRKQFPRLCAYEEELVRYHCAAYYQAAICQLCQDMWPEIVASEAFEKLPKTKEFFVFFGAYKGEGEVIA